MLIKVADPISQTAIFSFLLFLAILFTTRLDPERLEYSKTHTDELKGLAMLMVIFSHVGYFLSSDTRFLFPLSICAGVGVNLFLVLSGFGLTTSAITKDTPRLTYYKKRFANIYLPMWVVITILLVLDFFVLGKSYPLKELVSSYLGYFPSADIYKNLDSPLWYFTFIAFYYLIFPWVFSKKRPVLSALAVTFISLLIAVIKLPVTESVQNLYQTHLLTFPAGMFLAVVINKHPKSFYINYMYQKLEKLKRLLPALRILVVALLVWLFAYLAVNSGVGKGPVIEQLTGLTALFVLIAVFLLKRFRSGFLVLIGAYSYEIYLIHWPILYRYDFLYRTLPASVATFGYLFIFVLIAFLLQKMEHFIKGLKFA